MILLVTLKMTWKFLSYLCKKAMAIVAQCEADFNEGHLELQPSANFILTFFFEEFFERSRSIACTFRVSKPVEPLRILHVLKKGRPWIFHCDLKQRTLITRAEIKACLSKQALLWGKCMNTIWPWTQGLSRDSSWLESSTSWPPAPRSDDCFDSHPLLLDSTLALALLI